MNVTIRDIVQILFILLIIGGPIISAIAKKMQEAKLKREREIQIRRRQEEMLRTGRSAPDDQVAPSVFLAPTAGPTTPTGPASEAEALRRLQELARQRQAQSQTQAAPPRPQPQRRTTPVPQQRQRPTALPPAQQRQSPQQRPIPQAPQRGPAQQQPLPPKRAPQRREPQPEAASTQAPARSRATAPTPTPAEAAALPPAAATALTGSALLGLVSQRTRTDASGQQPAPSADHQARLINDLRRAIVMREVLDKPLCFRDEQRAPGA